MKRKFFGLLTVLWMVGTLMVSAQTNLTGRTYHHQNIMADMLNDATKDLDKKLAEARAKAIDKSEKKKGRKLTAEELAKVDEEVKKQMELLANVRKGMSITVTVEFKDQTNMVMKQKTKVSDEVLKAAGYGWLKRKALKAALAMAPSSEKGTYIVKDNMVIMTDKDNEKDTMFISQDGKYLTGKLEKNRSYKLPRIK